MDIHIPDLHEEVLREVINKLPDITNKYDRTHLVFLACRSRKARDICKQKIQSDLILERQIIRGRPDWKTRYFDAVYNYNILQHIGKYTVNFTNPDGLTHREVIIPPEAFGIYSTISPRNVLYAVKGLSEEQNEHIFNLIKNPKSEGDIILLAKTSTRFFAQLHKNRVKDTHFVTVDVDTEDVEFNKKIRDMLSVLPKFLYIHTTRGFQYIMDVSKSQDAETYFHAQKGIKTKIQNECKDFHIDFQNDSQMPLASTLYYRDKNVPRWVEIIE
jgi:hypothetical protein